MHYVSTHPEKLHISHARDTDVFLGRPKWINGVTKLRFLICFFCDCGPSIQKCYAYAYKPAWKDLPKLSIFEQIFLKVNCFSVTSILKLKWRDQWLIVRGCGSWWSKLEAFNARNRISEIFAIRKVSYPLSLNGWPYDFLRVSKGIGYGLEDPGFVSRIFSKSCTLALGITRPTIQWVPWEGVTFRDKLAGALCWLVTSI
jgi:hypothetical protein